MLPRLSFAPRRLLRSDFVPEWAGAAAILFLCAAWAAMIGFRLDIDWRDGSVLLAAFAAVLAAQAFGSRRFALMAEYFALTLIATAAFGILSYLSMTTGRPLIDGDLQAADRALGFDWLAGFDWLQAHPAAANILRMVYDSLVYQGVYFGVLFGLMRDKANLREMFWIVFLAGVFTSTGAALFPAFGTYKTFGLDAFGAYLPDMMRLHAGHDLHFALSRLTGVVSFPSFHTTMALAYIYGFRRSGPIGWLIAPLNIAMLTAIPFFGGHYLVDMLAGAGVLLASLGLVKAWPRLRGVLRLAGAPQEAAAT